MYIYGVILQSFLSWIKNNKELEPYVSRRIETIRSYSLPSQWFHVDTSSTPADVLSRGCLLSRLKVERCWFEGLVFCMILMLILIELVQMTVLVI